MLSDQLVEGAATAQLARIKFLSLKNLGGLLAEEAAAATPAAAAAAGEGGGAAAAAAAAAQALGCYVAAAELEGEDVVLWNRMGTLVSVAWGGCMLSLATAHAAVG